MLKTLIAGIALTAGLGMLSPSNAEAGGFSFRISIGGHHRGHHASFQYSRHHGSHYGFQYGYGGRSYDGCGSRYISYTPSYSYSYRRHAYPQYRGYTGYRHVPRYTSYRSRYGYGYCR